MNPREVWNPEVRRVPLTLMHVENANGNYIPKKRPSTRNLREDQIGISGYEKGRIIPQPISPVFPDTPQGRFELAQYCTNNCLINGEPRPISGWAWELFGRQVQVIDLISQTIVLRPNT